MLFQWVLLKFSAVRKSVKSLWVAYLKTALLKNMGYTRLLLANLKNWPFSIMLFTNATKVSEQVLTLTPKAARKPKP